jgi:hypothetical protein
MSSLRSARIRTGSAVLVAIVAALAGACGRKPQPMSMSAAGRWLVGYPGQDTAKTIDYMKDVDFPGTSNKDTVFTGPYPCNDAGSTSTTVELTVTPEEKAFQIDWDRAFRNEDGEGALVAMIENKTASPYPAFGSTGNDTVYAWVGPINADGSDRAVTYYKIDKASGKATAAPTAYRKVTYCDIKGAKKRSKSAAHGEDPDKKHCFTVDYTPAAAAPAANTTAEKLPLFTNVSFTSAMFRSNGTWISCVYGCCEVGYAQ